MVCNSVCASFASHASCAAVCSGVRSVVCNGVQCCAMECVCRVQWCARCVTVCNCVQGVQWCLHRLHHMRCVQQCAVVCVQWCARCVCVVCIVCNGVCALCASHATVCNAVQQCACIVCVMCIVCNGVQRCAILCVQWCMHCVHGVQWCARVCSELGVQ